jgi:hypothetical protein
MDLIQGFAQNPSQFLQQLMPPTSALQQQVGNTFSQLLSGLLPQQQTGVAGRGIAEGLGQIPGGNVISAALPVFNQRLTDQLAQQQQVGPRFASAAGQQAADLRQRSMQDFNLFAQQAFEQAAGRQQNLLGQAGQFALGESGQALQGLLGLAPQFLGPLFFGGGITQDPLFQQKPGTFGQIMGTIGTLGALAAAIPTGGASLAALPGTTGMATGGNLNFQAPTFGGPISNPFRRG